MKKIIGFATEFYTLWDYETQPQYKTDAYGNHHLCGVKHNYFYIKNISTDLNKVKVLFPDTTIDEGLRGKTSSWTNYEKKDLPNNIFWGGKYNGKLIDEILISDFKYCLWAMENYNQVKQYVSLHPIYLAHISEKEKEINNILNNASLLKVGDIVELVFETNGYNADDNYTGCWAKATFNETTIFVNCSGVKRINGIYPYLMPEINGKAQKTKGKKVQVHVIELLQVIVCGGIVEQSVKIK